MNAIEKLMDEILNPDTNESTTTTGDWEIKWTGSDGVVENVKSHEGEINEMINSCMDDYVMTHNDNPSPKDINDIIDKMKLEIWNDSRVIVTKDQVESHMNYLFKSYGEYTL